MDSLSLYFTKFIFDTLKYEKEQEIPLAEIKHAVGSADGEQGELLKMFVGGEH